MNKNKAKEFYEQADEYCRFITENVITTDKVPNLMKLLMTLYVSAMNLPDTEPETIASLSDISEAVAIRFSDQIPTTYWEIFDLHADKDTVCGDLIDDLSDIAIDLKKGMNEYKAGRIGNAIFEWRFGLNNHWGLHIVDALRALHFIRAN